MNCYQSVFLEKNFFENICKKSGFGVITLRTGGLVKTEEDGFIT